MLLTLGGLEVEALQERHLAYTSFRSRGLRHGDALIYLLGPLHLLTYTARRGSALNDVRQFEDIVAQKHGVDADGQYGANLLFAAVGGAADPLTIYSLYSIFYRFLIRGDRAAPYPALRVGRTLLSATTRPLLVPWGREQHVNVLIGLPRVNIDAGVRVGGGPGGASLGVSAAFADVWLSEKVRLGGQVDVVWQPGLAVPSAMLSQPRELGADNHFVGVGGYGVLDVFEGPPEIEPPPVGSGS